MSSNTRQQILHRCYEAIQTQGFELLRTDKEIIRLKITKGAFYHYFPNKLELGYAVIDEILLPNYSKKWETLLSIKTNIGNTIVNLLEHEKNQVTEKSIKKGDILYNLMVEMSHIDEVFREKLENVHDMQVTMLQRAILTGRASGEFKNTMDARSLAMNIIGGLIGCYSIAKVRNSKDVFTAMISTLQKQVRESLVMEFSNENSLINRSGNSKVDLAFNDKVAFIDSESNKQTFSDENETASSSATATTVAPKPAKSVNTISSTPSPNETKTQESPKLKPAVAPTWIDPTSPDYKQPKPFPALDLETKKDPTPSRTRFSWFSKKK
ncbi:MAG: TetR/AcrR family transcriptional regulator [Bacteroidota bacterium]